MDDRKFTNSVGIVYCLVAMLIGAIGIPLAVVQLSAKQTRGAFDSPLADRDVCDPPETPTVFPLPYETCGLNPEPLPLNPQTDLEALETPSLPVYRTKPPQSPPDAFERSEVLVVVGEGCPPCRVVLANLVPDLVYRGWVVTLIPSQTTPRGPIPRFEIRAAGWTRAEFHEGLLTPEQFRSIFKNHVD